MRDPRDTLYSVALAAALSPVCYIVFGLLSFFVVPPIIGILISPNAWLFFFPIVLVTSVAIIPTFRYLYLIEFIRQESDYALYCGWCGPIVIGFIMMYSLLGPQNNERSGSISVGVLFLALGIFSALSFTSFVSAFMTARWHAILLGRTKSLN